MKGECVLNLAVPSLTSLIKGGTFLALTSYTQIGFYSLCVKVLTDGFSFANRKEFFEGCKAINADSIDGICSRFPSLLNEAKQEDKFKDLYRFTFQFGLDSEEGQRSLHREIAIALWKLVFTQNNPPILDQWLNFLIENPSGIKGISRDTWNMFLNFTQVIGPDLSNYSEDEAWPSLFDTFVEWEMERRKKEEETKCITCSDTEGPCIEEQT